MIEERERMMSNRSRSIESHHERTRPSSNESVPICARHPNGYGDHVNGRGDDDDDDDDEDYFDESDSSVTRILKRRMKKKKKPINRTSKNTELEDENLHFDNLRRRLSR